MDWLCAPRVVGRAAAWYLSSRLQAIQAVQKMTLGIEPPQDRSGIHHPFPTRFYLFYPQFWGLVQKLWWTWKNHLPLMRPEGLKWLKSGKDHHNIHNFADFAGLKASQRWNLGANFRPVETRTAEGLKKSWDPLGGPQVMMSWSLVGWYGMMTGVPM